MDAVIKGAVDTDFFAYLGGHLFNTETYAVFKDLKAIVDTGAQDCLIKKSVAAKLGLKPVDKLEELNPVGGILESDYFKAGIITDTANYTDESKYAILEVGTIETEDFPADMILGGTFLRHCRFTFDGPGRTFELHITL